MSVSSSRAEADREVGAQVLENYLTKGPGLFLYFPARTQTQPNLRALVDMVTELGAEDAK